MARYSNGSSLLSHVLDLAACRDPLRCTPMTRDAISGVSDSCTKSYTSCLHTYSAARWSEIADSAASKQHLAREHCKARHRVRCSADLFSAVTQVCSLLSANATAEPGRDMLAWVHQALASERELLLSLFGEPDADATADIGSGGGDMPSIARLLNRVFESICKPLKARPVSAGLAACCVTMTGLREATVH